MVGEQGDQSPGAVYWAGVGPLELWFLPSSFLIFLQKLSKMHQGYLEA